MCGRVCACVFSRQSPHFARWICWRAIMLTFHIQLNTEQTMKTHSNTTNFLNLTIGAASLLFFSHYLLASTIWAALWILLLSLLLLVKLSTASTSFIYDFWFVIFAGHSCVCVFFIFFLCDIHYLPSQRQPIFIYIPSLSLHLFRNGVSFMYSKWTAATGVVVAAAAALFNFGASWGQNHFDQLT